jgi:anti-sigma regulatory factor (Ser/Thr protein kinase)
LREAFASLRQAANADQSWAKQLRRSRAKFRGDDEPLIEAFAETLHADLVLIGASEKLITDFETVFNELVQNALLHGCQRHHKAKVIITCDYSPWFVRLRVADSGKGFPFSVYRALPYYQDHGLGIVSNRAARFDANDKGNVVTALLKGLQGLVIEVDATPTTDDILYLIVSRDTLWHYSAENWTPLPEIINESGRRLVMIDCKRMSWSSLSVRTTKGVLHAFSGEPTRRLAYILNKQAMKTFDFSDLNTSNSRVFRDNQYEQARSWLLSVGA